MFVVKDFEVPLNGVARRPYQFTNLAFALSLRVIAHDLLYFNHHDWFVCHSSFCLGSNLPHKSYVLKQTLQQGCKGWSVIPKGPGQLAPKSPDPLSSYRIDLVSQEFHHGPIATLW